jgi:hypothetical protein
MATPQRSSSCVLQLVNTEPVRTVECAFCTYFGVRPSNGISTYSKYKTFKDKGCICISFLHNFDRTKFFMLILYRNSEKSAVIGIKLGRKPYEAEIKKRLDCTW